MPLSDDDNTMDFMVVTSNLRVLKELLISNVDDIHHSARTPVHDSNYDGVHNLILDCV